jgi:hypothetical protein
MNSYYGAPDYGVDSEFSNYEIMEASGIVFSQ